MLGQYGPDTYGRYIADYYDEHHATFPWLEPTAAVEFLATWAGRGPALELGIGTGRVGIPLAERGVEVHGIDASPEMVERLREKPGGERVTIFMGDFADVDADPPYRVVYAAFNTFFALTTQEAQVQCFRNVREALADTGVFVIEACVPYPWRFIRGQRVGIWGMDLESIDIEATLYDPVAQLLRTQHIVLSNGEIRVMPRLFREVWPAEFDLMAQLADLRLLERWGEWDRRPFDTGSIVHISVYGR
jgi:SAM-dependent methyltransferase